MATVVLVETKGTSPRYLGYLEVPQGTCFSGVHGTTRVATTVKQATVGGVGGVKGSRVAPSSPQHQQTSYNSILCLFALLFRSSFEAVASLTNIIFVTPPRRRITLSLHVMQNDCTVSNCDDASPWAQSSRLNGRIIFWSAQPTGDHSFTDSKQNKADENKLLSTTRDFTHEDL